MASTFHPPGIKKLSEVDPAEPSYGSESTVIHGVVSPSGQGGWGGTNDEYEIHSFTLAAWHRVGNPVIRRDLLILDPVPPNADYWEDFPKYSISQFRVLLSTDETRAILQESHPIDSPDQELIAIAAELRKSVVVHTVRFGPLTLDRRIDWFEGETKWNANKTRINFSNRDGQPPIEELETAAALWNDSKNWEKRILDCAVKNLLELKNDCWVNEEEGDMVVSQDEFIQRMTLDSVSIKPDGEFEFWYKDGDLFFGHSIMVSGDLKNGPTDAGIHG